MAGGTPDWWSHEDDDYHPIDFPELLFLRYNEPNEVTATLYSNYPSAKPNRPIECRLNCSPASLPSLIERYCHFGRDGFRPCAPCRFLPITGTVLEDWLSVENADNGWVINEKEPHLRVLGDAVLEWWSRDGFSSFPANTKAAELEHHIISEETNNPLALLDKQAGRFVELFAEASNYGQAKRKLGVNRLRARLRKMQEKTVP
jgi:hypothetical protein